MRLYYAQAVVGASRCLLLDLETQRQPEDHCDPNAKEGPLRGCEGQR